MLEKWLRNEHRQTYSGVLHVRQIIADTSAENEELDDWLARELVRNYFSPQNRSFLAAALQSLDADGLAQYVLKNKFPDDDKVRLGEFGEALVGAVFRRMRRYTVPILKLRYKHRPNAPVQGADLMAFRLSSDPPIIAIPEVKTRSRRIKKDLAVGTEAHESLASALRTIDASIEFVAARLLDQQNSTLGIRVMALLADGTRTIERHIFVIHEDEQWDDRIIARLEKVVTESTETTVIRMREVRERIATTYAAAARVVRPEAVPAHKENAGA